ncbi:MAG: HAD family hydrolase [Absicoccus porci]|uniref:Cof-type HAD-IIB family hydrolase n=1 Tax=Absicoccus porci TaxID=2486576 RepID=UPI002409EFC9|nr:HAD family hydrolase [Absicoccus porci]MDD6459209.1 HAD family hydrolase [Absicoccus porci]
MNIHSLFFDLDDTLLDVHSKQIAPSSMQTLQALKTKGYRLGIASSRPLERITGLPHIHDIPWDGYVTTNGVEVYDSSFRHLEDHTFSSKELAAIFAFGQKYHIPIFSVGQREMLTSIDPTVRLFMKKYDVVNDQCKPYEGEKQKLITYITADVETFYQKLKDAFPQYSVVKGGPFNIDIFPKGYTKLTGIQTLMDHWQEPNHDFMAFGDSYSDICAIQAAKIGVAMHHALEPVKAVADYICPNDRSDAIAQAIHHFGLL